jgi:hypothetical protein
VQRERRGGARHKRGREAQGVDDARHRRQEAWGARGMRRVRCEAHSCRGLRRVRRVWREAQGHAARGGSVRSDKRSTQSILPFVSFSAHSGSTLKL